MDPKVERFINHYNSLSISTMHLLDDMYQVDVHFIDPIHEIYGIVELKRYFENLYTNVQSIVFELNESHTCGDDCFLYWTMEYQHKALNRGKTITVTGHSHLRFADDKVAFHRDYIDVGQMLYEHIPVIGWAIKHVKSRASA